jgi:hypothetical protein
MFIASDDEVVEWKRQAAIVRMNFSAFIRARLNQTLSDEVIRQAMAKNAKASKARKNQFSSGE